MLNERFQIRNGYIEAAARTCSATPPRPAGSVPAVRTHEDIIGVAAPTIRLIREPRHLIDDDFRADAQQQALFLDILRAPTK